MGSVCSKWEQIQTYKRNIKNPFLEKILLVIL